jgi:choline dehydrogenase-like flavoprotein
MVISSRRSLKWAGGATVTEETFDFIIIGAGTAGCVVANRLSADASLRVLLLEAGPVDSNFWIHVPLGYGKSMFNPKINWCSWTAPIEGIKGQRVYCPRGKCLGGTSSINGMLYVRGQPEDYDDWARIGAKGWDWNGVLPYFRRLEDHFSGNKDLHGTGGPVHVSEIQSGHPLADAFIESAQRCGISRTDDYNGKFQEGASYFQVTIKRGKRVSAADAYIRPIIKRRNFKIETEAMALRINCIDGAARSVTYRKGGSTDTAVATKEIIISAGAIGSPQLLQLSGIGPAQLLRSRGIDIVADLPGVGEGFQDHVRVRLTYRCNLPITTNDDFNIWHRRLKVALNYFLMRSGPLATGINHAAAFAKAGPVLHRPNIQLMFGTLSAGLQGGKIHPFSGFTIVAVVLRPVSRGFVRVTSQNPEDQPEIQPNYFADERDLSELLSGIKLARKIANTPPLKDFVEAEYVPGEIYSTEMQLSEFVRENSTGTIIGHPVGSCRMGQDNRAVVNERLCVRGIRQLRVVDASVMPSITSGNTNGPTFMIGEKASDLIVQDWKKLN